MLQPSRLLLSVLCKSIAGGKVWANGMVWASWKCHGASTLHDARLAVGNQHASPGCSHIHLLHNAAYTPSCNTSSPIFVATGMQQGHVCRVSEGFLGGTRLQLAQTYCCISPLQAK